ncbi:MAG: hypothetical protein Q4G68_13030 [Planctomycetia bacterium]|nr:hypothetical protein [Planctomycetia bacterium]
MRKGLIFFAIAIASVMSLGCASGYRSIGQTCPNAAQASGKFASSYEASSMAPIRIFGAETEPYNGAPVYVVNGGAEVYEAGWGRHALAGGRQHYVGSQPGHSGGLFSGVARGTDFEASGPLRRNAYARRAAAAPYGPQQGATMYNSGAGIVNPYPGNTPTRSPRDFFAPNPPSIGP